MLTCTVLSGFSRLADDNGFSVYSCNVTTYPPSLSNIKRIADIIQTELENSNQTGLNISTDSIVFQG